MASKIPTLKTLALMDVSKKFWHASFNAQDLGLNDIDEVLERKWEIQLRNHRIKAVCNLSDFIKDGNLPLCLLSNLKENIFTLYDSYHKLCLWKITYDPYDLMEIMEDGDLHLPQYFTTDGEFNNKLLLNYFIHNTKYHIVRRFCLACYFCLEIEAGNLWYELRNMLSIRPDILGNFNYFTYFNWNTPLILYMIFLIEYSIAESEDDWDHQEHFWLHAFEYAIGKGYEQAVYKLWGLLPESKQLGIILENNTIFKYICSGIEFPKNYVSYFFFTKLPHDRKLELLEWTKEHNKVEIWCVLLFSLNSKDVFLEGMEFYKELTIEMFPRLFAILAEKIWKQQRPSDMKAFEVLWNHLGFEEKDHTIENCSCLFENLSKGKAINILSCIVRNLTIEQKIQCLFYNRYEAGITVFDNLCKNQEFEMFERYLSSFLINTYSNSEGTFSSLIYEANTFLKNYLNSSSFKTLCNKESFKGHENELKARIDSLQTCLTFVNDLCFIFNELDALQLPSAYLSTLWKEHSEKKPLDLSL